MFYRSRYEAKSPKVYRKVALAPEISGEIVKSLSQDCSCARDIKLNRQKSVSRLFLRQRYEVKSSKVCRKFVPSPEILSEIAKSLSQDCSCARDISSETANKLSQGNSYALDIIIY